MKLLVTLLPLLLLVFIAYGQADVQIGLKTGVKLANGDAGSVDTEGFLAFQAGAFGLIKFDKIGVQPEVLWSRQGAEFDEAQDFDLNYINIPIMFKYYLNSGLNLQAGPQFGILIGSEDEDGNSIDIDLRDGDFGAVLGVGWDFPSGVQLSARYINGFVDITDVSGVEYRHRI